MHQAGLSPPPLLQGVVVLQAARGRLSTVRFDAVSWIAKRASRMALSSETLFLAVQLYDRCGRRRGRLRCIGSD